jgi:CRP-like cAMP-binding protein
MSTGTIEKGAILFKQNSFGDYFYILKEGEVSLYIDDKLIKNIVAGESFGELALLHCSPRSGTIKANAKSTFYCLERAKFKQIVDTLNEANFNESKQFIKSVPSLDHLENDQKTLLCMNIVKEIYDSKTYIVKRKILNIK